MWIDSQRASSSWATQLGESPFFHFFQNYNPPSFYSFSGQKGKFIDILSNWQLWQPQMTSFTQCVTKQKYGHFHAPTVFIINSSLIVYVQPTIIRFVFILIFSLTVCGKKEIHCWWGLYEFYMHLHCKFQYKLSTKYPLCWQNNQK